MKIVDIVKVLNGALGNVCTVGTIIVLVLFIVTCIVRNSIINRTTTMLTILLIAMWVINVGLIIFLLISGGDSVIGSSSIVFDNYICI